MAATNNLIILAGPTAVGKTKLSIELAKRYDTEIISSDSRQYYKELSIGTAKPTIDEQEGIRHHFIDSLSIFEEYSIGQFERDVIAFLDKTFQDRNVMIMTGGSGMHIRAITHGLDDFPDIPDEVKAHLDEILHTQGISALQEKLKEKDPIYAETVDMDNPRRLMRALSVIEVSQQAYSTFLNQPAKLRSFKPLYILLERDREELYNRIDRRVNKMMEAGLLEEAQQHIPHQDLQALNTIGYKELFTFLDGEIDLEKAKELIQRNTRRYAKRQLTWFRKEDYWNRFHPDDFAGITSFLDDKLGV